MRRLGFICKTRLSDKFGKGNDMADMVDCGQSTFSWWAKGSAFKARFLGAFDPTMAGEEAAKRLDMIGKVTASGIAGFVRGWEAERSRYLEAQQASDPASLKEAA